MPRAVLRAADRFPDGIDVFAVVVQGDDLILAGLYAQQRDPHVVLHANHNIPFPRAGLDDDAGFGSFEPPFGDAYPGRL